MGMGFVSTLGPRYGSFQVYADGTLVRTRTAFGPQVVPMKVLCQVQWPADGAHTLTIVNEGTPTHSRLDVDGFLILS